MYVRRAVWYSACNRSLLVTGQGVFSATEEMCSVLFLGLSVKEKDINLTFHFDWSFACLVKGKKIRWITLRQYTDKTFPKADVLFGAFHPPRASCFSVSLSLFSAAPLWSVGYSCCVLATVGSNGFSLGQSRIQAVLTKEHKVKFIMHIFFMTCQLHCPII